MLSGILDHPIMRASHHQIVQCNIMRDYVFILCPPYQGSTILVNLLATSPNVTTLLDTIPNGELQWLFPRYGDTISLERRSDPTYCPDMNMVLSILHRHTDPRKPVLVEKSPENICRAKHFQDHFEQVGRVHFIVSIRNPYSTNVSAEKWVEHAKYQKHNIETLKNITITSYEECCTNLPVVIARIQHNIPKITSIRPPDGSRKIPNQWVRERLSPIHADKINRVIDKDEKNKVLRNHQDLMGFFGYNLIE